MKLRFFARRTVYVPTLLGWTLLASFFALPGLWWFNYGEAFLSVTSRVPARILVVEGWVGPEGLKAAKAEFETGGYDYLVTSGGLVDPDDPENWTKEGWTYAEGAGKALLRLGVPSEKVIFSPPRGVDRQRSYTSAVAVKEALSAVGIAPQSLNVFSSGAHARRTWMVYEKAYGPETKVGIIAFEPPAYASKAWWHSSERAIELMVQTVGFFYEFFLNSGRKA